VVFIVSIHVRLSLHVTNDSSSSGVHVVQVYEICRIQWCDVFDVRGLGLFLLYKYFTVCSLFLLVPVLTTRD